MKQTLFLAKSRLGIENFSLNKTALDPRGVEMGPNAVISNEFLEELQNNHRFKEINVIEYDYPSPESEIAKSYQTKRKPSYLAEYTKATKELKEKISKTLANSLNFILVGGDHSVALASVSAVLSHFNPKNVGYIQIDSHADLHLANTSLSGNIHGMWARPMITKFDYENLDQLIPTKLPPNNYLLLGDLDLEKNEEELIQELGLGRFSVHEIFGNNSEFINNHLLEFINKHKHIHLSIDIDSINREFAPATGIPCKNGFTKQQIIELLTKIKQQITESDSTYSIDLVEVNPKLPESDKTIELAQKLIRIILD